MGNHAVYGQDIILVCINSAAVIFAGFPRKPKSDTYILRGDIFLLQNFGKIVKKSGDTGMLGFIEFLG